MDAASTGGAARVNGIGEAGSIHGGRPSAEGTGLPTKAKTYRLPEDVIRRIEEHRLRVQARAGIEVKESAVVVALLRRALEAVEADGTEPAKPSRKK